MKSSDKNNNTYLVLYNIRSIHNVGSIFRTANCFGVKNIFLVGFTPTPVDRFGRARKDFAKVSLGADVTINWRHFVEIKEVLSFFRKNKICVVAIEQSSNSIEYSKIKPKFPIALVVGNEVEGIPEAVLKKCDLIAEIPMKGTKESLNVSVATGIALARMLEN